ncbi:hypothetical protein PN36_16175 [Candidatus Thiomargarita nelsonii]|uniref:Sulfotransferase domain-containing protein n=1 Tax=Candidatus Thiomargarita nelsonii TaxID=1003181 RepID=A0A0A6PBK9_9GAMM|nr:hypothetical protein PN36_16175 [Candidatus Thiomargarita nelsonii]
MDLMKTIYIHIGTHKTGSSTLQLFFDQNRERLKQLGFFYPTEGTYYKPLGMKSSKSGGQRFLVFALKGVYPHWINEKYQITKKEDCIREIREHIIPYQDSANILISAEYFFTQVKPEEMLTIFERMNFNFKIIIYLRRQDKFLESLYNQNTKNARYYDSFELFVNQQIQNKQSYCYFYNKLFKFAQVFGRKNIIVRPFEIEQFYHQNLNEDFLNILGLSLDETFSLPTSHQNESLPTELIQLMVLLQQQFKADIKQRAVLNQLLRRQDFPLEINRQKYSLFSPKWRRETLQHFEEDNARIAREFLNREDGRLFYEPLPDREAPWEQYPGLSQETVADTAITIWQLEQEANQQLLEKVEQLKQELQTEKDKREKLDVENRLLINVMDGY